MCVVVPVPEITAHRTALNTGMQVNYNLPFKLSEFYNPVHWARMISGGNDSTPTIMESLFGELSSRAQKNNKKVKIEERRRMLKEESEQEEIEEVRKAVEEIDQESEEQTTTQKYRKIKQHKIQKRDLTAAQFYSSLQDMIQV